MTGRDEVLAGQPRPAGEGASDEQAELGIAVVREAAADAGRRRGLSSRRAMGDGSFLSTAGVRGARCGDDTAARGKIAGRGVPLRAPAADRRGAPAPARASRTGCSGSPPTRSTTRTAGATNPSPERVGGHQSSSTSSLTLLTALYFKLLRPGDRIAVKPTAAPVFYAIQVLRGLLPPEGLRAYRSLGGLQAYPSRAKNPDWFDFSTGSMGLGAVAPALRRPHGPLPPRPLRRARGAGAGPAARGRARRATSRSSATPSSTRGASGRPGPRRRWPTSPATSSSST